MQILRGGNDKGRAGIGMSHISERLMRGDYISKAECMEHSEEITRTFDCYSRAMEAMRARAVDARLHLRI